jgi:excisionase family DNA binding protein
MPRMKKKPEPPLPPAIQATEGNGPVSEVFMLREAAAYLRLAEADVLRLVHEQKLPARQVGQEWRFLKTAIQDWLRSGPPPSPGKEAQLAAIGSWKDDPYLEDELNEIYKRRGRPMTEDDA